MSTLVLSPGEMTLSDIQSCAKTYTKLELTDAVKKNVLASYEYVHKELSQGKTIYGINTGFGALATVPVSEKDTASLQKHLLLSHAVGVGKPLPEETVRVILALKINSLARGYSGISLELLESLVQIFNAGIVPVVPEKGSVGASGDLAPLAHCYLPLIQAGNVFYEGQQVSAKDALTKADIVVPELKPKEGLALINGTQVSTALALNAVHRTRRLMKSAVVIGAMTTDAMKGSSAPFHPMIHEVRGHNGQSEIAAEIRRLLQGSEIMSSHKNCTKVQDPYSLRCQPQVIGSALTSLRHVESVLEVEANGVTDNPLIFKDNEAILSGGNFHAEPVAMVADYLALAIAELGSMSERRISLMMDKNMSALPAFLVKEGGLHSGFMIAQVTAAALVSENKTFAHPAVVDSLPTSANQEDHVSMATFAARRLRTMIDNVEYIYAIELLSAIQALRFHEPLKTSEVLFPLYSQLKQEFTDYADDRILAVEMEKAKSWLEIGRLAAISKLEV